MRSSNLIIGLSEDVRSVIRDFQSHRREARLASQGHDHALIARKHGPKPALQRAAADAQ